MNEITKQRTPPRDGRARRRRGCTPWSRRACCRPPRRSGPWPPARRRPRRRGRRCGTPRPGSRARSLTACTSPSLHSALSDGRPRTTNSPGQRAAQVALEGLALDRGQEADPAVVDADHRRAGAGLTRQGPQDAAVAAEHQDQVLAARREARCRRSDENGVEDAVLDHLRGRNQHLHAGLLEDRERRPAAPISVTSGAAVGEEQDALDRAAGVLDRASGTTAAARGLGDSMPATPAPRREHERLAVALRARAAPESAVPRTAPPRASTTSTTRRTASSRACRVAHDPARADPARADLELRLHHHHGAPCRGRGSAATAGQTVPTEMKERSQVTRSGAVRQRRPGAGARALVRSMTCTRGSWRSRQSSCP